MEGGQWKHSCSFREGGGGLQGPLMLVWRADRVVVGDKVPTCWFGGKCAFTADIERLQLMHNINVDHLAINKFRSKSQKH